MISAKDNMYIENPVKIKEYLDLMIYGIAIK